ncbi:prokaryotic phospholipase A2-domain-containing protein [Dendryphion nanum]|uniref:Prokaryotic phospholipase A2-domain-containing protein n=1 Tax=Dendryphion nanum TaxID=256645 RepID=A0A9P9ECF8_9PLEO|nr:prokaryotic phospholipase A2-domain-containing protein [Dendryphion nanum]
MKNIFVSILAVASLALAAPLESRQESATQATDRLLFSSTISQFISARNARSPANLDWSADGCSSSPDNPLGFNFLNSCLRHDFGYRNYKAQSRFTANGKSRIDVNFRSDMYNQCNSESLTTACRAVADLYYRAVVEFGLKRAVEYQGEIKRAVIEAELEKIRLDIAEGKI